VIDAARSAVLLDLNDGALEHLERPVSVDEGFEFDGGEGGRPTIANAAVVQPAEPGLARLSVLITRRAGAEATAVFARVEPHRRMDLARYAAEDKANVAATNDEPSTRLPASFSTRISQLLSPGSDARLFVFS
jgi:hypothetical protein